MAKRTAPIIVKRATAGEIVAKIRVNVDDFYRGAIDINAFRARNDAPWRTADRLETSGAVMDLVRASRLGGTR